MTRGHQLREILRKPGIVVLPGVYDCIGAKLVEQLGFPVVFTVTGASFGVQAGCKTADIIMLVMDPKGVDALLSGAMTIGSGNVSATSGSVGYEADVATMRSSIITYARPDKRLFAGADLQGSSIAYDGKTIEKVYGVLMGPYETLYKQQSFPATVRDFHDILTKFAPRPKN
jgi:lipid-binding SYLF domain-containing protein